MKGLAGLRGAWWALAGTSAVGSKSLGQVLQRLPRVVSREDHSHPLPALTPEPAVRGLPGNAASRLGSQLSGRGAALWAPGRTAVLPGKRWPW